MKIIGIIGKKHSGKTTVAEIIRTYKYDYEVYVVGFADALKVEVANATGYEVSFIEEHKDNFRLILQGWGTDLRRRLGGENYWVDKIVNQIVDAGNYEEVDYFIIPDVRFHNEAKMVKEMGGTLIRIHRNDNSEYDPHPSETEMDQLGSDYVIRNYGTLDELKEKVKEIVDKI